MSTGDMERTVRPTGVLCVFVVISMLLPLWKGFVLRNSAWHTYTWRGDANSSRENRSAAFATSPISSSAASEAKISAATVSTAPIAAMEVDTPQASAASETSRASTITTTLGAVQEPLPASPQCFVRTDRQCRNGEGIGGLFRRFEYVVAIAMKYRCAYVCNVKDWETGGHNTGHVGHFFGCDRSVVGDPSLMVPASAIKGLKTLKAKVKYTKGEDLMRMKYGSPLLRSRAWYVDREPSKTQQVLEVHSDDCQAMTVTHETTWPWMQRQFHAVRAVRAKGRTGTATAWGAQHPQLRIALQLRRGDRPDTCPLYIYLNALRELSRVLPWISSEHTKILLIGEVNPKSEEFRCLKFLDVEILAASGPGTKGAETLLWDLDHMATSDVLILGGGGSFPIFAATLQAPTGIILHSNTRDKGLDDVPHAYELDWKGRFPCDKTYDFSNFAATRAELSSGDGAKFRANVELAIQEYMRWFDAVRPCERPRSKGDGFRDAKHCTPPDFSAACEVHSTSSPSVAAAPSTSKIDTTQKPVRKEVDLSAKLLPLNPDYRKLDVPCPVSSCLGKPPGACQKNSLCCVAPGSFSKFERLEFDHVALFVVGCGVGGAHINHDFHQRFWPFFWWTAVYNKSDFAILLQRERDNPKARCPTQPFWTEELFWTVAKANSWKVVNYSFAADYCFTGKLHILQGIRKCCDFALKPPALLWHFKGIVSSALTHQVAAGPARQSKVLVYTRQKSEWRRLQQPQNLRPLFPQDFTVDIVDDMPNGLAAQAHLMASYGLILAPNGGWSPNALFIGSDCCLIELHLYKLDSWISMFGIGKTIGEVLLIVGDYRDPRKKRIVRKARVGGDDDFVVHGAKNDLFKDIHNKMQRSRICKNYLAS